LVTDKSIVFIDPEFCKLLDNPSSEFIVAFVNDRDIEVYSKDDLLKAWKVNLTENKLEEIEADKVTCINQWFGYDDTVY
jgi:hypothetical protein